MNSVYLNDARLKSLIPHRSGVYFFRDAHKHPVYIGKANDLCTRIVQHMTDKVNPKEHAIQESSVLVEWRETNSEFEALLFEASCIKKYQPKYNVDLRDGKTKVHVAIMNNDFPYVILLRESRLQTASPLFTFGPLHSARFGRYFIGLLRKSIPFSTQIHKGKPCFYAQLHQCDPCPGVSGKKSEYMKVIHRLKKLLNGNGQKVIDEMEKEMKKYSDSHKFEEAAIIRDRLSQLRLLFQRRLVIDERLEDPLFIEGLRISEQNALASLMRLGNITRIECFDVSTFSAKQSVASCVVFINGVPAKEWYRRFRIRGKPNFDPEMMREVVERRLSHSEWPLPDVLVIDGGVPQLRAVMSVLQKKNAPRMAVIGIAKRPDRLIDGATLEQLQVSHDDHAMHVVQRIRDEAHRFAKAYHVTLRKKLMLKKTT